jgi:hypothetical protein
MILSACFRYCARANVLFSHDTQHARERKHEIETVTTRPHVYVLVVADIPCRESGGPPAGMTIFRVRESRRRCAKPPFCPPLPALLQETLPSRARVSQCASYRCTIAQLASPPSRAFYDESGQTPGENVTAHVAVRHTQDGRSRSHDRLAPKAAFVRCEKRLKRI